MMAVALETILEVLDGNGYVVVGPTSSSTLTNIFVALGEVIMETDIVINPNSRAMVTSA
jgi:hypothetical protein